MILSIILGVLRHVLTAAGGALIMDGLHAIDPTHIAAGGAISAIGLALSVAQKVKTVSGADYSTLNK